MGLLTNSVFARAATVSLQGILSLPDPALRFPGGPAIEVDGQRLAPTAQLFLQLQQFIPRTAAHLAEDLGSRQLSGTTRSGRATRAHCSACCSIRTTSTHGCPCCVKRSCPD
jgi:hypothetical protein